MGTRPVPPHAGYQGAAFGSGQGGGRHVMACCGTLDAVLLLSLALRHHEAMLLVPLLDLSPLPVEEHLDV